MALSSKDAGIGFRHGNVVAFINERMARHEKGSAFYFENMSLSWEAVEDKLKAILEDNQVPSEAKEACAWSTLALGVRFNHRENLLHKHREQWLHDLSKLHKTAKKALVSDLSLLKAQHEVERKEAASLMRRAHVRLTEVQKERDLLRWKLFQEPVPRGPGLATASWTGAEGAGEEEEEAGATAPTAAASGATGGGGRQKDVEGPEAAGGAVQLRGDHMQLLRFGNQKMYTSGGQRERERDRWAVDTGRLYVSGIAKSRSTASQKPPPVQLPASFPSSHSCPLFPFPDAPTSSSPAAPFTAGTPSQASPRLGPSYSSFWSDVGGQRMGPQEPQREGRDSDPHQQGRPPVLRRPGEKICLYCGRGIWL